jgi:hypothetical protein
MHYPITLLINTFSARGTARGGFLRRSRAGARSSTVFMMVPIATANSLCAKAAPMQRRYPPPNDAYSNADGFPCTNRSGSKGIRVRPHIRVEMQSRLGDSDHIASRAGNTGHGQRPGEPAQHDGHRRMHTQCLLYHSAAVGQSRNLVRRGCVRQLYHIAVVFAHRPSLVDLLGQQAVELRAKSDQPSPGPTPGDVEDSLISGRFASEPATGDPGASSPTTRP